MLVLTGVQGTLTLGLVSPNTITGPPIELRALAITLAPALGGQVALTPADAPPLHSAGVTLVPCFSARAALCPALDGTPTLTEAELALMD